MGATPPSSGGTCGVTVYSGNAAGVELYPSSIGAQGDQCPAVQWYQMTKVRVLKDF